MIQSCSKDRSIDRDLMVSNCASPMERIIICIDDRLCKRRNFFRHIQSFMEVKKKIAAKPPEFYYLVLTEDSHLFVSSEKKEAIDEIFLRMSKSDLDEENPYPYMSRLFLTLANLIELPQPSFVDGWFPPYVYHVILFFIRDRLSPVIENTQAYYFLMDNPFFTMDICYIKNSKIPRHSELNIAYFLRNLIKEMGLFIEIDANQIPNSFLFQIRNILGHTLLRPSRNSFKALDYNSILDLLGHPFDNSAK